MSKRLVFIFFCCLDPSNRTDLTCQVLRRFKFIQTYSFRNLTVFYYDRVQLRRKPKFLSAKGLLDIQEPRQVVIDTGRRKKQLFSRQSLLTSVETSLLTEDFFSQNLPVFMCLSYHFISYTTRKITFSNDDPWKRFKLVTRFFSSLDRLRYLSSR